jgi:GGDEF domain-containing protein
LTGPLNHRRGFDGDHRGTGEAHQDNLPVVALMCDIDRFKAINDRVRS